MEAEYKPLIHTGRFPFYRSPWHYQCKSKITRFSTANRSLKTVRRKAGVSLIYEIFMQKQVFTSWAKLPSYKILFFFRFFLSYFFLRTLLKSSDFKDFNHISWQVQWFTSQMRCNNLLFLSFILFPDFFGFSSNLNISSVLTIFLYTIDGLLLIYDMIW